MSTLLRRVDASVDDRDRDEPQLRGLRHHLAHHREGERSRIAFFLNRE